MGAETSGRKIGIGLRLAARAAWQRAGQAGNSPAEGNAAPGASGRAPIPAPAQAVVQARVKGKAIAAGTRRFGEAVAGPIVHTGSVLWLEITGLFFGLFAFFFGQSVYKLRGEWKNGPDHLHFMIYSALTLVFVWFAFFNFYRARQKEKKKRSRSLQASRS